MCRHEDTYCPRCKTRFECRVGSIALCQCAAVQLNADERAFIARSYDDCLCASCMKEMKAEYHNGLFTRKLKNLFGKF